VTQPTTTAFAPPSSGESLTRARRAPDPHDDREPRSDAMHEATADVRLQNSTIVRSLKPTPAALRAVRGGMRILSALSPEGAAAVAERMFLTARRRERPHAEREVLARADARTLPSRHGDLAAWAWGPLEGPRVLLVHGWEGRGAQLGPLVEPLTAAGFRVFVFDAPGHGDSRASAHPSSTSRMPWRMP
jgi:hypothetical protein